MGNPKDPEVVERALRPIAIDHAVHAVDLPRARVLVQEPVRPRLPGPSGSASWCTPRGERPWDLHRLELPQIPLALRRVEHHRRIEDRDELGGELVHGFACFVAGGVLVLRALHVKLAKLALLTREALGELVSLRSRVLRLAVADAKVVVRAEDPPLSGYPRRTRGSAGPRTSRPRSPCR